MTFVICETFIFQDKFCKRLNFFFSKFESRITQLSYALSSVKKYIQLAFLSEKEDFAKSDTLFCKIWERKKPPLKKKKA